MKTETQSSQSFRLDVSDTDEDGDTELAVTPPAAHFVESDAAEDADTELASTQPTFHFGAPGTDKDGGAELAAPNAA